MKRGRKPTVSNDEISSVLKDYKDEIIINNRLIVPSSSVWKTLIENNNWNIHPKALWTRIHKFSPYFDNFFNNKKQHIHTTLVDNDSNPDTSDLNSSSDQESQNDDSLIYTVFISAEQWKIMQRDDGIKNKLKPGFWTNTLADAIYDQLKFNCAWSFKSHEVPINKNSAYFFHFTAICTDTKCRTKIRGEVLKHKNLADPLIFGLNITLYIYGNNNVQHLKKRRFEGNRRQEIAKKLLNTFSSSSLCRKELASQLSTD